MVRAKTTRKSNDSSKRKLVTQLVTHLGTEIATISFPSEQDAINEAISKRHRMERIVPGRFPIDVQYLAECKLCDALIISYGSNKYSGTALQYECHISRGFRR